MSAPTPQKKLSRLRRRYNLRLKNSSDAIDLFKQILIDIIDYEIEEYSYPLVILIAGVNGVGKTTAIGKLAHYFISQGKSVTIAAADTFRRQRPNNWRFGLKERALK